jgi:hypothetical protein
VNHTVLIIADVQSEGLPDLQSFRAGLPLGNESSGCPITESGASLGPLAPIYPTENSEASRGRRLEYVEVTVEYVLSPTSIQVQVFGHTGRVEKLEKLAERFSVPASDERISEVVVCVDDLKARALDQG